jgi:hypothetical protein
MISLGASDIIPRASSSERSVNSPSFDFAASDFPDIICPNPARSSMAHTTPTTSKRISEAMVRTGETLGLVGDFGFTSAMKISRNKRIEQERQTIPHNTHRLDGCHPYMADSDHGISAFIPV